MSRSVFSGTDTLTTSSFKFGKVGMNWVNVSGSMHEAKNINIAEVNKCVDLTNSLASQYPDASIGIITPFRDQSKAISEKLPLAIRERVKPDTVHRPPNHRPGQRRSGSTC